MSDPPPPAPAAPPPPPAAPPPAPAPPPAAPAHRRVRGRARGAVAMTDLHSAWQAALAAEHEAVFGYGVLGPHVTGSDEQLAISCSSAHEALRDATEADLAGVGLTPVAPA